MKILIIGGTKFLGRHLVTAAQARNHEITLFNRGRLSRENVEGVEQLFGDRNSDLEKLEDRRWDAVIDTCGYLPQSVKLSAEYLKGAVGQYVFVSSLSAYADFSQPNFDETAPAAELTAEQQKKVDSIELTGEIPAYALGEMYGPLKVQCERTAEKAMPGRVLNVRSGLIVGEFDPTDRFTYWATRVARGGEVLAPGEPNRFVQLIDASDLAEWIIKMIEQNETGVYNATSKPFELTMSGMLEEIKNVSGSDAEFVWVREDFLKQENIEPWSDMPLYLSESEKAFQGFLSANVDNALKKGLSFRPLSETIRDTLEWRRTKDEGLKAGITAEREKKLLRKWHEQS